MSRGEDIALAGNQFIERSMGKRSACETLSRSLSLSLRFQLGPFRKSIVATRYYTQVRFTDRNFEFVRKFRRKDIKKESLLPVV